MWQPKAILINEQIPRLFICPCIINRSGSDFLMAEFVHDAFKLKSGLAQMLKVRKDGFSLLHLIREVL
jgi:hypothetical protein